MEATVLLETFNSAERLCSAPLICASTQSCLWALQAVPKPHGLVFALISIATYESLYRQVCAFPNHVQSWKFSTGGHLSKVKKHLNDDQEKWEAPELNFMLVH